MKKKTLVKSKSGLWKSRVDIPTTKIIIDKKHKKEKHKKNYRDELDNGVIK